MHIVLCFLFVFPRLVYPMLPVSLDCPFLIAPSVFLTVYVHECSLVMVAFLVAISHIYHLYQGICE